MIMPRVVHFEIHADEPERAAEFYKSVFEWEIQKWDGSQEYWMITTGKDDQPGINGGMMKRQGPINGDSVIAYVCTIDIPSVDDYVKKITAAGGHSVVPKMPIPGMGWLAYCKDTEGNIIGLIQGDPTAK
jgi:predicted enzyme related to lactoylglutathione lyase